MSLVSSAIAGATVELILQNVGRLSGRAVAVVGRKTPLTALQTLQNTNQLSKHGIPSTHTLHWTNRVDPRLLPATLSIRAQPILPSAPQASAGAQTNSAAPVSTPILRYQKSKKKRKGTKEAVKDIHGRVDKLEYVCMRSRRNCPFGCPAGTWLQLSLRPGLSLSGRSVIVQ